MPVSILIINKTGDIVFRNTVFNNIIKPNYNNLFHFMSEDSLEKLNEDVAQATEHHKIISNNLKLQKTINESLYFIYYLIPLGKRNAYVLVLVETTEIHNNNIMFNNIINAVPDPIVVKDEQYRFMYVNQAFAESLGCPIEDILGKSDVDFFLKKKEKSFADWIAKHSNLKKLQSTKKSLPASLVAHG